jgi:hypothetical protein
LKQRKVTMPYRGERNVKIGRRGALRVVGVGLTVSLLPRARAQGGRRWPHELSVNGAQVTVYQPQAISWPERKTLTARVALAINVAGATRPVMGTIDITLETTTDVAAGVVHLSDPKLIASHFPSLDTQQAAAMEGKVRAALSTMQMPSVPLSAVVLSLKQAPMPNVAVNNDPPEIFYSQKPACLVVFDGEPVLVPIGKTGLSYAVNTNWDVFKQGNTWYLLAGSIWMEAPSANGPYRAVAKLPAAFDALPHDANFANARAHIPGHLPGVDTPAPAIFVSTKPAEIIVTEGTARLDGVPGTSLQRVSNTISTVFYAPAERKFYYLVSGRWFSAASLAGPWTFATDKLPPDLALLPAGGANDPVLAAVPGTAQAQVAVLQAQLPQTATLKRDSATLAVAYSGAPRFEPIPGTTILYAVNTPDQVLKVGDKYYACYQGAWFVSSSPTGPWVLADSVPQVIYTIPPSSPMYNVTYVQVYGATPTAVTYGYTAGYMMGFITAGVMVYGTGYYYPPVVIPGPVPIYYPYPYTYAGNVWYNSSTGAWARGGTIYGPYGAASGGRYYNPYTGGWAQAGAIYGPYGGAGAWSYYNPRTGSYAHGSAVWGGGTGTAYGNFYNPRYGISGSTTQNANAYSRWGSSTFAGPNQTVNTASGRNAQGAAGGFRSSSGAAGAGYNNRVTGNRGGAVRTPGGDVYAGRDGNVYQHTDNGWSKWNNGNWNPVRSPQQTYGGQQRFQGRQGTLGRSDYQQLEQDRLGRQFSEGRFGGFGGFRR